MLGKLAGAWIGEKIAGRKEGAKGAILGAGAVAVGKRVIPTLVTVAALGWAGKKLWDRRKRKPHYPSEATPRIPASETKSPS